MKVDPPVLAPGAEPKSKRRMAWWGLAVGVGPAFVNALFIHRSGSHFQGAAALQQLAILAFCLDVSIWPLSAVILSCCRPTRRFGVGMLMGVGIGWLTMLAICGGRAVDW